ncbi:uncharacterized protein LOC113798832 [Dermatophagoides pteronyssinus]|uniref:uncharacterized protein LOC113798832 n=1 Tax=Dermatophagoides pteronyssinus TaxID=6956 RepID=UPI003F66545D
MFTKRPTACEDEDDLLRQQNEFLAQNPKIETKSVGHHEEEIKNQKNNHDIVDLEFKIIERNYDSTFVDKEVDDETNTSGFPEAPCLFFGNDSFVDSSTKSRSLSLYAQKCLKRIDNVIDENKDGNSIGHNSIVTGIGLGSKDWRKDISEIRRENQKILDNMSPDDIEKLRDEIMKKLSPKTVEFLKSKKFSYRSSLQKTRESIVETITNNQEKVSKNVKDILDKIPIKKDEIKARKYIHMDVIENDKLEWIGDVNPGQNVQENDQKSQNFDSLVARFNFEGVLLTAESEKEIDTIHQGLHHHGDNPERPGYTIDELFIYLQSSFPSQKQIGLKVFEKIVTKAYQGFYDSCFNMNLVEYLLKESPLVLIVRSCLDETADTVWKSAIQTLKALICNTIYDEIFLDRGFIIFEDFLNHGHQIDLNLRPTNLEINEDDIESFSDQQYLIYDIIGCLLNRTSILERFAYLLNNHMTNESMDGPFQEDIFDILIRFARHSPESSDKIINCSDLINAIGTNLTRLRQRSLSEISGATVKIFKLFRCCINSVENKLSRTLRKLFDLMDRMAIIDSINFFFLLVPEDFIVEDVNNVKKVIPIVSIEALRLWIKLLSFCEQNPEHDLMKMIKRNFFEMCPFLLKTMSYCRRLTPSEPSSLDSAIKTFDFKFASCVMLLIKMYHELLNCPDDYANQYCFDLYDIAMKWFIIIHNESIVPDFDCSLCILVLVEFIIKHLKLDNQFIKITLEKLLGNNQRFFKKLIDSCRRNSNTAKREICGRVRDSPNLPSYGSIYLKGFDSVPLFRHDSAICLLQSLIRIACIADVDILRKFSKETFDHLFDYINLVTANINGTFSSNIFDLIEINIVAQACLITGEAIRSIDCDLNDNDRKFSRFILNFVLMINVMNNNQIKQELLQKCLFDQSFYSDADNLDFKMIRKTYENYSQFDHRYWLFDPLLTQVKSIFSNQTKNKEEQSVIKLEELASVLLYIEHLDKNFSEHFLEKINVNQILLFEILCTTFLINEDYFFDNQIDQILRRFLIRFVQTDSPIQCSNEDKLLDGMGTIIELFNKFSDQFVNSSYYNTIFCNYLFVYLQPKCSNYFRCHFLSEYSFSVKMSYLKFDEMLLPIRLLLYPIETNLETLEVYLKTLLSERFQSPEQSVLYCMLVHHLHRALFADDSPLKLKFTKNDADDENYELQKQKYHKLLRSIDMSTNIQLKTHLYECSNQTFSEL